jgi:hypothetical protein
MTDLSEIRASADSDVLPVNECDLDVSCDTEQAEIRNECDHLVYMSEGRPARMHARLRLTFCPKCGEKL